jgi:4'-phosphopantetheinyl transferase
MGRDPRWLAPPASPSIEAGEVHVWRAWLDSPAPFALRLDRALSADERARAARLYFARDRRRFIAGRGLLRAILGGYLGVEPRRVRFEYGLGGKPRLRGAAAALQFNLAHSHGLALYTVARGAIGVDVERVRAMPDIERIAAGVLSARELAVFRGLPGPARLAAFFACWTRKEAYVKARGDGLARQLDRIDVSLAPWEPERRLLVEGAPREAERWSLRAVDAAPGYAAALAVAGPCRRLALWEGVGGDT